ITLTPTNVDSEASGATVAEVAKNASLDSSLLQKLVEALKNPALEKRSHPLHLIQRVSKTSHKIDGDFKAASQTEAQTTGRKKWLEDSTLFEDFNDLEANGIPKGWFRTGYAFGTDDSQPSKLSSIQFSHAGGLLRTPGAVHSGQYGEKFFGVIRSPTFELNSTHIHYRVRGSNVTLRLIIDGFMMDEFNALLYRGCKTNIPNSESFVWQVQTGDLKNHLGHRAYIEIIDHGDGFAELDEIRFSNGAKPIEEPNSLTVRLANSKPDSIESISKSAAEQLISALKDDSNSQVANWIVDNGLTQIFLSKEDSSLSSFKSNQKLKIDSMQIDRGFVTTSVANSNMASVKSSTKAEHYNAGSLNKITADIESTKEQLKSLMEETPHPILAHAMTDGTGEEEPIHIRGNHKAMGKLATRHFLSAISPRPLNPPDGSGRLLLAQKMTAPNNPLTSRVAVNRIWHHMLGRGIVESVDNFGVLGKKPTHPELLDYLASEFSKGWSTKRMIKRIAMTKTYQMSSQPTPDASTIDPDNNLLHRARIRRLQGEAIRDSILQISGRLDPKLFGPPVPIHLTRFMQGRGRPRTSGPVDGAGRRSIYISVRRNFLSPMMLAFDTPIPFNAIGKRNQSNVPAQALIMLNSPFVIEQAKVWADKIVKEDQTTEERIKSVYAQALGRDPSDAEIEKAKSFIALQAKTLDVPEASIGKNAAVWQDFCHIIFNLKEFIYIN
ncbi:MAG: DUF1553 domain-containing protein, partial [Mariniblastus sp.]